MLKYLEMCFFLIFFLFYLLFGIHLCTFWSNCYLPAVTIIIKLYDIIFSKGAARFALCDLPMHIARCRPGVVASLQTYLGLATL